MGGGGGLGLRAMTLLSILAGEMQNTEMCLLKLLIVYDLVAFAGERVVT